MSTEIEVVVTGPPGPVGPVGPVGPAGPEGPEGPPANSMGVFNVLDYGAVGDSATDDTDAIQDAIDACSGAGGGVVYLPPGTFKHVGQLLLPNYCALRGAGRTATTLKFDSGTAGGIVASDVAAGATWAEYQSIADIAIRCDRAGDIAVDIANNACRLDLRNLSIRSSSGIGLRFYGSYGALVTNCYIANHTSGTGNIGIQVKYHASIGTGLNIVQFRGVEVQACDQAADIECAQYISFLGCVFQTNRAGIKVSHRTNIAVKESWFEANGTYDILYGVDGVTSPFGLRVEGCIFASYWTTSPLPWAPKDHSIKLRKGYGVDIRGNWFLDTQLEPIEVDESSQTFTGWVEGRIADNIMQGGASSKTGPVLVMRTAGAQLSYADRVGDVADPGSTHRFVAGIGTLMLNRLTSVEIADKQRITAMLGLDEVPVLSLVNEYWNGAAWVATSGLLVGGYAGTANTGSDLTAIGPSAGWSNSGSNSALVGTAAGQRNAGNNATALGHSALRNNLSANATAVGAQAGSSNSGQGLTAVGYDAAANNSGLNNTVVGDAAQVVGLNTGAAKTLAPADINLSTGMVTITGHGWGSAGDVVTVQMTSTGTIPAGTPNPLPLVVVDADTLSMGNARSASQGTGTHTFTPYIKVDNVVAIGASALAETSNTVQIGNNAVAYTKFAVGKDWALFSGAGSPEGVIAATVGCLYRRTDGGAGTSMYVKESGTGTTGWVSSSVFDGTVTNADVAAGAAIDVAKLAGHPTTTVDNTLPRFDGVAGSMQTSGIVVSDTNNMSGVGTLTVAGLHVAYSAKTGAYAATTSDDVLNVTDGTFTLNLPAAATCQGKTLKIRNAGTGVVTVDGNSGETIDEVATFPLGKGSYIEITSTGANWILTGGVPDTYWRDVTADLKNSWAGGYFLIRRVGSRVEYDVSALSAASATSGVPYTFATGWRIGAPYALHRGIWYKTDLTLRRVATDTSVGDLTVTGYNAGDTLYGSGSGFTLDAWPVSLPGSQV